MASALVCASHYMRVTAVSSWKHIYANTVIDLKCTEGQHLLLWRQLQNPQRLFQLSGCNKYRLQYLSISPNPEKLTGNPRWFCSHGQKIQRFGIWVLNEQISSYSTVFFPCVLQKEKEQMCYFQLPGLGNTIKKHIKQVFLLSIYYYWWSEES